MGYGIELVLSGTAVVCCVHNREKRKVPDRETALMLAHAAGLRVKSEHRVVYQTCACCENVFATFDSEPRLCHACVRPLVHEPGGPLAEASEEGVM